MVCEQGALALRGRAEAAAPYVVLRRLGDGTEIRRYQPQTRVCTPVGEVYSKESYDYATDLLLAVSTSTRSASLI